MLSGKQDGTHQLELNENVTINHPKGDQSPSNLDRPSELTLQLRNSESYGINHCRIAASLFVRRIQHDPVTSSWIQAVSHKDRCLEN